MSYIDFVREAGSIDAAIAQFRARHHYDEINAARDRVETARRQLNACLADREASFYDYDAEAEAQATYDAACADLEALEAGTLPASAEAVP